MDPSKLFRKAALEKLASPERLDEMMQIIAPTGWLAVIAVGCSLVALTVWSVVGDISIKVSGKGMLLRGGVVFDISSDNAGRLAEVLVKPGDHIVDILGVHTRIHDQFFIFRDDFHQDLIRPDDRSDRMHLEILHTSRPRSSDLGSLKDI